MRLNFLVANQATAAMRLIASNQPSKTRLLAIQAGWRQAVELQRKRAYMAKCLFSGDPNPYYGRLQSLHRWRKPWGQAVIVGRDPPTQILGLVLGGRFDLPANATLIGIGQSPEGPEIEI